MLNHLFPAWSGFGSNRPGFCIGTASILIIILLVWLCGIHTSLSLGPGGEFPGLYDFTFYAVSHEELVSLVCNGALLLCLGPLQERRWGSLTFLVLSLISTALLPPIYALFLFVTGDEASRVCGYSATLLALFTAQCRQVKQRRVLRCLPLWSLPWCFLLLHLFLLPSVPGLLHFYAICLGLNYSSEFINIIQKLESLGFCSCLPVWAYVPAVLHNYHLPTHIRSDTQRQESHPELSPVGRTALSSRSQMEDFSLPHAWPHQHQHQQHQDSVMVTDTQLLDQQMLRAGILASLQDINESTAEKVEVPKSSVSSIRLQQLERMGFPTEKAVVALAAAGQLDRAISLLIHDQIGEDVVVVSKGKKNLPPPNTD